MLKFYQIIEKVGALHRQLTWYHYLQLLKVNDENEIKYYINLTIKENLSYRSLSVKIKSDEYHRLPEETRNKLLVNKVLKTGEEILNPIVIHTSEIKERFNEKVLQELIMDDLNNFLSQLGEGFTYVRNEYKLNVIETNNYIDILLYNIKSNRYCVVELKVRELKREDIGQIKMYMNYIDINLRSSNQNKTIGILITRGIKEYEARYIEDNNIYKTTFKIKLTNL